MASTYTQKRQLNLVQQVLEFVGEIYTIIAMAKSAMYLFSRLGRWRANAVKFWNEGQRGLWSSYASLCLFALVTPLLAAFAGIMWFCLAFLPSAGVGMETCTILAMVTGQAVGLAWKEAYRPLQRRLLRDPSIP